MNQLRLYIFGHQLSIFLKAIGVLLTMKTPKVISLLLFLLHQNRRNYLKKILYQRPKDQKNRTNKDRLIDLKDWQLSQLIMLNFITHGILISRSLKTVKIKQKMRFAVRECKVNLGSYTPQNYLKAILSSQKIQWIEAMQEEFDSHKVNKTWELAELPKGRKVFPGRWVYKKRYGPSGAVERYKTRWVVKGFHQVGRIDHDGTCRSVVKSMI